MDAALTAASKLVCPHKFPMKVTPSQRLLTVDGKAVLVKADLLAATFDCTAAGPGIKKRTTVASVTGGLSTTLQAGGEPVALATATGTSDGNPPTSWQVLSVNQSRLEAA